ncbi:MAG: protein kinase [Myxococcales bacterium]|nr:protein kinase [Myxococcales bacterium]
MEAPTPDPEATVQTVDTLGHAIDDALGWDVLEEQRALAKIESSLFARARDPVRLSRYLLLRPLGSGGTGVVYDGYDPELARRVAVKVLRAGRNQESTARARARFLREAQSIARLSHPNVIAVYDVGTYSADELAPGTREGLTAQDARDTGVFIVMELVEGQDLATWLERQPRTWREVVDVFLAAGEGLAGAHAAGIVHRDFKAANVLVRRDGAVRVVDFGLARQELEASAMTPSARPILPDGESPSLSLVTGDSVTAADAPLTRTGVIMGTPAYMAPEQHLGQRADVRSDQFSYCVSLFEALYGFRPFAGETLPALRRNVLAGRLEQPPRYTDIPPRIFKVLQRGLQVHPSERYPAMEPLLDELVRDPRVALRRLLYGLLVVLAAAAVAGLWWSEREERSARAEGERLRAQFERARVLHAEEELRRAKSRTVSEKRDDLVLAYAREVLDGSPTTALAALKHVTRSNTDWLPAARTIAADAMQRGVIHRRRDPGVGRIEQLAFAADGELLVMAGQGVVVWSIATDEQERLADPGTSLVDLSVTPDGTRLAAVGLDGALYLWDRPAAGEAGAPGARPPAALRRIESPDDPLSAVALAPDGESLATGSKEGLVRLWEWSGRSGRAIRDHEGVVRALDYSPDGLNLVSAGSDRTIRIWRLERETHVTLEHGPGIRDVMFDGDGEHVWSTAEDGLVRRWTETRVRPQSAAKLEGVTLLARSASGDEVLACRGARELTLYGTGDPQPLDGLSTVVTAVALAANGTWAAAATGDEHVQLWHLVGAGGVGTEPDGSRVVSASGSITALAFSRAGGLLASATRQGTVELWSERGEPRGQLGRHGLAILDLGFSPQGHELAAYDENGQIIVWSVADRDQPPVVVRERGSINALAWAWSVDGDRVAAPTCETMDHCEVVLYPISGQEPQVLSTTDSPPSALRFSPSGRHLLSDHPTGSWLWDLDEGQGRMLEWPDGRQPDTRLAFAYVRGGLRMATADVVRDHEAQVVSTTLRVWHIGQHGGDVHLLFEEPDLRTLLVDTDGRTLLLRTSDDNTLLWRLASDHFRVLPSIGQTFDRLITSPDAQALLLRPRPTRGLDERSLWVDVESGQMRRFSRRNEPMAWSARGTIADATARDGLRIWSDPTPDEVGAFLRWLDETTDAEIDAADIR